MKNFLKNRALLTVLAVVMVWGSLTFALAPKAHGCPPQEIDYTYYTDNTYTTACGYKIIPCSCGSGAHTGGCQTAYYTIDYYDCF
ncbi:MAG TPA: hypothetical protein VJ464_30370 [Blastocatellia bacterium]|nr:hypothetical protein [Blastocatellia bacterium]